ncbi:hypothetical protein BASA60_001718 [Batrachochytrium salamandrivorans]|nr:hypothetical protein BASA60_001718 [Batrachochytrium salamandrivorans]KAH9276059.1 hypothetical protein BASA83_001332 [Batrachochytrium salamandrivorans]
MKFILTSTFICLVLALHATSLPITASVPQMYLMEKRSLDKANPGTDGSAGDDDEDDQADDPPQKAGAKGAKKDPSPQKAEDDGTDDEPEEEEPKKAGAKGAKKDPSSQKTEEDDDEPEEEPKKATPSQTTTSKDPKETPEPSWRQRLKNNAIEAGQGIKGGFNKIFG